MPLESYLFIKWLLIFHSSPISLTLLPLSPLILVFFLPLLYSIGSQPHFVISPDFSQPSNMTIYMLTHWIMCWSADPMFCSIWNSTMSLCILWIPVYSLHSSSEFLSGCQVFISLIIRNCELLLSTITEAGVCWSCDLWHNVHSALCWGIVKHAHIVSCLSLSFLKIYY